MNRKIFSALAVALVLSAFVLVASGCLGPQFTYQGRLTDASGNPLSGTYLFTFKLYKTATGGTAIYTETETVTVTNGLFDVVVGPENIAAGLKPEDLADPLYLEVTVSNFSITQTLSPRQRLYGAPYAFTLMPGAVISQSMNTSLHGAAGAKAVLNVVNPFDGTSTNPALPALRLSGETALELTDRPGIPATDAYGVVWSDRSGSSSNLWFLSNDDIWFDIDDNDDIDSGFFTVYGNTGSCSINEAGALTCTGTKSAVVATRDAGPRKLYAIESPGVWFEDFGRASLVNGQAVVSIDPLFAQTVNLSDYHVFLTPLGDCKGLYVAEKTSTSFVVKELGGGTSSVAFDYRIVARRLGYENVRLEPLVLPAREERRP
ncbi:MAG: hypothetical protein RML46_05910 [Anaerolineae bacterium]|nr:hypothetical protein [Anaerolineae bacterium]MDW8068427.1 hypothetical protein [Anaerolineae bacterium]